MLFTLQKPLHRFSLKSRPIWSSSKLFLKYTPKAQFEQSTCSATPPFCLPLPLFPPFYIISHLFSLPLTPSRSLTSHKRWSPHPPKEVRALVTPAKVQFVCKFTCNHLQMDCEYRGRAKLREQVCVCDFVCVCARGAGWLSSGQLSPLEESGAAADQLSPSQLAACWLFYLALPLLVSLHLARLSLS